MKIRQLSDEKPASIDELKKVLLSNRSIVDEKSFFSPPSLLNAPAKAVGIDPKQLKVAVTRIQAAIEHQEQIVIYGDYDADGISATAVLWQALYAAGARVKPFIPRRDVHGYGLSIAGIDAVERDFSPSLIITVDNGIVAVPAVLELKKRGIEVIITDHHQEERDANMQQKITNNSVARVHTTQLCGATVAWFLAREFSQEMAEFGMDLVGLATIADQVPLTNWNRAAAVHGLAALRQTQRVGLQALADQSKADLKTMTSTGVGYTLAPRINAMGRLAHGLDALRLLCTHQTERAYQLAAILTQTNTDRQELTADQYDLALSLAEEQADWPVTVVAHEDFHEGVVGLIAGRLVEKLGKPALVIQVGEKLAKGSARSIPGVSVVALLRSVREHLTDVGGHPMAAGFSLEPTDIPVFVKAVVAAAVDMIKTEQLEPEIEVECELESALISLETVDMIEQFAPFGSNNPEPVFLFKNVPILETRIFGREEQHLQLTFGSSKVTAIFWNQARTSVAVEAKQTVSIVGTLNVNTWKNRKTVQVLGSVVTLQKK